MSLEGKEIKKIWDITYNMNFLYFQKINLIKIRFRNGFRTTKTKRNYLGLNSKK